MLLLLLLLQPLLCAGSQRMDSEYRLQMQDAVVVQAGLCVRVHCNVSYPRAGWNHSSPVLGYWYKKREASTGDVLVATNNQTEKIRNEVKPPSPFYLSGDPGAGGCSLSISAAGTRHSGKYYFRLERGPVNHTFEHKLLTVNVTVLTQSPEIHVKKPLEAGRQVRLACSLPGACAWGAPTFSWTGAALRSRGRCVAAFNTSEIPLTPRPQDHGTNLTCQVAFPGANVSSTGTIRLNVSYAPQNLAISVSRGSHTDLEHVGNGSALPVREGDSLRLLCVAADSNPPATLRWTRGAQTLSPSGVLELPRVEMGHEGEFTCRAQHPRGSLRTSLRLLVQNPPQLLGPSCSWENQGLHCSCSSRAQPAPSLRWRLGAGLLEGNHGNGSHAVTSSSAGPWTNSSLSLRAGLSPDLRLSCEAQNVHGAQSTSVLLLPGKPAFREAFALGAVAGAGVVGLLSLCLTVFMLLRGPHLPFRAKTCRRDAPPAAAGEEDAPSRRGPSFLGSQPGCLPGSQRGPQPPAASPDAPAPSLAEELELHYATLSFQGGRRPGEPPHQEAANTDYAEIKIRT